MRFPEAICGLRGPADPRAVTQCCASLRLSDEGRMVAIMPPTDEWRISQVTVFCHPCGFC